MSSTKKSAASAPSKAAPAKKKKEESDEESESESEESEDEKPKKKPAAKKAAPAKKAATKKKVSSDEEESDDESESEEESDDDKKKKKTAPARKPAPKKVPKKESSSEEEESSSDEESDDEKAVKKTDNKTAVAAAASNGKKGKGGNNKNDGKKKEENLDDIFAELGVEIPQKKKNEKKENDEKKADTTTAANEAGADAEKTEGGEKQLSKAALKRQKQKEKEKAKAAAAAAGGDAGAAVGEKKEDEKKPDKKSKGVAALKEKLARQKEEEDRRKKEEEDRKAAEEAEAKRLEELAKKEEEDRKRKLEERAAKREEARKQGKLLSKAEKEKQLRAEMARKMWAAQGIAIPDATEKRPKVSYGKKKKDKKNRHDKDDEENDESNAMDEESTNQSSETKESLKETPAPPKPAGPSDAILALTAQLAKLEIAEKDFSADEADVEEEEEEELFLTGEEIALIESKISAEEEAEVIDSWDMDEGDIAAQEAKKKEKFDSAKKEALDAKKQQLAAEKEAKITAKKEKQKVRAAKKKAIEEEKKKLQEQIKKTKEEEEKKTSTTKNVDNEAKDASKDGKDELDAKGKKKKQKELRSPIVAVLGHVDTGKTKILDRIRSTNVQEGEAGGITQQIGATYVPKENIERQTTELLTKHNVEMRVPGLLIIDTPGHESFTNLRSRGSGLCDIAILVVDIMHGLEPQTIESLNLLKQKKTPFIVALNKIDRMYGWKAIPNATLETTLAAQTQMARNEFEKRAQEAMTQLMEQGMNVELFYKNTDVRKYVNVVPTSAITGEGIPDLLYLMCQLTQNLMNERLTYAAQLQCTVLEVKQVEGLGTTIDVILVNGTLNEGDTIVVAGMQGPIVTQIRSLLTPPPMREIRVKSEYIHNKQVKAAMGVKISAHGLEQAIAGSSLVVWDKKDPEDLENLKDEVQADLQSVLSKVDKSGEGCYVVASTLGSLEALLSFFSDSKIPVFAMNIGTVFKADVMRAAVMLDKKRPEFACILAFDVKVSQEAAELAEKMGVKIFTAQIIYHLFDSVTKYMNDIKESKKLDSAAVAVFPCVMSIIKVFNAKNPLVIGVKVIEGIVRIGTPLVIEEPREDRKENHRRYLGRITSIEKNHETKTEAKKDDEIAIKVEMDRADHPVIFGRHFDEKNRLVSKLTRESIDLLKAHFTSEMTEADWKVVIKLKKFFEII